MLLRCIAWIILDDTVKSTFLTFKKQKKNCECEFFNMNLVMLFTLKYAVIKLQPYMTMPELHSIRA